MATYLRTAPFPVTLALVAGLSIAACGGDAVTCGPGTTQSGTTCVAAGVGGSSAAGGSGGTGGTGGSGTGGSGATVQRPEFAGVTDVSPAGSHALLVSWEPAVDPRSADTRFRYIVYAATAPGEYGAPLHFTGYGTLSRLVTGLTPGTPYYFRVRSVTEDQIPDLNTVELSGTPAADAVPPTFGGVTAAEAGDTAEVTLSWAPASDDLSGERGLVYLAWFDRLSPVGTLDAEPAAVSAPGATSMTVRVPAPDALYNFVVRARDAAGNVSANTEEVFSLSGPDLVPPQFGGCTLAVPVNASAIQVYWDAPLDDTTPAAEMRVRAFVRKEGETFDLTAPAAEFLGGGSGRVSGLDPDTLYYVTCDAVDAYDNASVAAGERIATTLADDTPPVFAGITSITDVSPTGVTLHWDAATDDQSLASEIEYLVYQAAGPAEEDFTTPTFTSAPGVTSIPVTGLTPGSGYFFVVRARDAASNVSQNLEELSAVLPTSFSINIQPIFTANCALEGCHAGSAPAQGMRLQEGLAYSMLVNVPAVWNGSYMRVLPGNKMDSYLFIKITNDPRKAGSPMPLVGQLDLSSIELIGRWITEGALDN